MNIFHKFLFLFILIFFCIFDPYVALGQENLSVLVKKVRPSVITVYVYNAKGKLLGQGSGFFISEQGHLITNYHVLENAHTAFVETFNKNKFPIKQVLASNKDKDLILAEVDFIANNFPFLSIAKEFPEPGEKVLVIGSPVGLQQTVSDGIVSSIRVISQKKVIQITAPISHGSSGSPVVNMNGEVFGVASFQLINGQNLNFAHSLTDWTEISSYITKPKTVSVNTEDKDYFYKLGVDYFNNKLYEDAATALERVTKLDPNNYKAHYYLGLVYTYLGNKQLALEEYKSLKNPEYAKWLLEVIQRKFTLISSDMNVDKSNSQTDEHGINKLLKLGIDYYNNGRYQSAKDALEIAVKINPNNDRVHYYLGLAYTNLGYKQLALGEYERLKNPEYAKWLLEVIQRKFGR